MFSAHREPVAGVASGSLVGPDFDYKPGFKVGLGFNTDYDDWTVGLEYTWMHQSTSHSSTATAAAPFHILNWEIPHAEELGAPEYTAVSNRWKMHLDKLDLAFSRPYYQGQRLTVAPIGALRGLWIRQTYNITGTTALDVTDTFRVRSHSWAVGPMVGANTHWILGAGFRFEGVANGALLYTRYTKMSQTQTLDITTTNASYRNLSVLRPMAELGVGLGWGTYFGCQEYYFDVSARYDFNVLWNQNVMAEFVNSMNGVPGTTGNLYMHGLTLNFRFDF